MEAATPAQTPQLLLWGAPLLQAAPSHTPGDATALPFAPERRFQLLVLLALNAGQWLERDRIATLLWPAQALSEARRNLRKVVFRARAVAGAQALEATDHALRWPVTTDLQAFDEALRRGEAAQALAWRRGVPFEGIDDPANAALGQALATARARFEQNWVAAALDGLRKLPDAASRARAAQRVLEVDPLDETAMAALLVAERELGHEAEALSLYRRYATRLGEELGVEPSRALREIAQLASPLQATPTRRSGDSFVGRRLEMGQALALLARADCRALTLLGPGGTGKSRLARQLRPACAALFPGGTCWVELQDTTTLPATLARIAHELGATLQDSGDAVEQLLRQLPPARTLLMLDNVEHLPALEPALQRLLEAAPTLVVLLTSRARPDLAGGCLLPLQGLAVPDEDSRDFEAASSFDAVRLFEQCALAVRRDFQLERHLSAVIDIVEAVAGLPLAIELAAGWVRLLPPEQVAQDLRGSIDLLERDPAARSLPARPEHTSLRAVLEGTWLLVGPREREALAALSVCAGGFTRAAAAAVGGCSLPLLSALVDKSLVAVDEAGRFALHPIVAAHARELLHRDAGRAHEALTRHAAYFARALAELRPAGGGTDMAALVAGVRAELANALAAWRQALERGDGEQLAGLLPALRIFFESQGRLVEGAALFREALVVAWPSRVQALLQHAVASLLYRKGDLDDARVIAEAAVPSARACGDSRLLADCLRIYASSLSSAGRPAEAQAHFEQALALLQDLGDRPAMATALSDLGVVAKRLGQFEAALQRFSAALAIDRELGNSGSMAIRLNNIGNVHMEREHWALARSAYEDGLRLPVHELMPWVVAYLEYGLGVSQLELGALAPAARHLQAAREQAEARDTPAIAMAADAMLARVAVAQGDLADALARLQAVARRCRSPDLLVEQLSLALYYGEWLRAAGRPGEAAQLWQCVAQHAADVDAGLQRSAERWLAALPGGAGQTPADAPLSLDEALDALLAKAPPTPDRS